MYNGTQVILLYEVIKNFESSEFERSRVKFVWLYREKNRNCDFIS